MLYKYIYLYIYIYLLNILNKHFLNLGTDILDGCVSICKYENLQEYPSLAMVQCAWMIASRFLKDLQHRFAHFQGISQIRAGDEG